MCVFELDLEAYPLPADAALMIDVELMHGKIPNELNDKFSQSSETNTPKS